MKTKKPKKKELIKQLQAENLSLREQVARLNILNAELTKIVEHCEDRGIKNVT